MKPPVAEAASLLVPFILSADMDYVGGGKSRPLTDL